MNAIIKKYKHIWFVLGYAAIYLPWFIYLEKRQIINPIVVHMKVDNYIPFNEFFIIPYMFWFFYVSIAVIYFLIKDKEAYYKLCFFLFSGMTLFLIISTFFPNVQYLRPHTFKRNNICTYLVSVIYSTDTPTNLFPSIHVYNSLGVHIAVQNNKYRFSPLVRTISLFICTSIILSTVFLKQHSIFDVIFAFICAIVIYPIAYKTQYMLETKQA